MAKEKKSFKQYSRKHLATKIELRRKTAVSRREKTERLQRRVERRDREAAAEEREHVEQLRGLATTDPEFYSYLESEDPTLLQYGQEDGETVWRHDAGGSDEDTETEDDTAEVADADRTAVAPAAVGGRITEAEVEAVIAGKKVEPMLQLFLSAIMDLGYTSAKGGAGTAAAARSVAVAGQRLGRRMFDCPDLVKSTLLRVARRIGGSLASLVGRGGFNSSAARGTARVLLSAIILTLHAGADDTVLAVSLLRALSPFIPVLHILKGKTRAVMRICLRLCASNEEAVRVAAFSVVRAVAVRAAGTRTLYQSQAFKGIFLTLIATARDYTIHTLPVIGFLMSSVVDLYGTDLEAAYQHAYTYIRELAVLLRAALQQQSRENVGLVCNWQYLNALRTWGLVVSSYPAPAQLGPLIHPVVQIALGLMDLFPSPRMFPMHLHVIEMLNHVAARAAGAYIPLTPYLLRILTAPAMALDQAALRSARAVGAGPTAGGRDKPGSTDSDDTELQFRYRIRKAQARSADMRIAVWKEALYLLTEHLAAHACTAAFPEAFWATAATLRKLKQQVKVPQLQSQLTVLLRHYDANAAFVTQRREAANLAPSDLAGIKAFEDSLREALLEKGSGAPKGGSIVRYHSGLREARVAAFAAKQQSLRERLTIEAVAEGRAGDKSRPKAKAQGKKRARDDVDAGEDDLEDIIEKPKKAEAEPENCTNEEAAELLADLRDSEGNTKKGKEKKGKDKREAAASTKKPAKRAKKSKE